MTSLGPEHQVELPSGTVTFLFTDIEGSTRLWEEQPDTMRVALSRHDAIVERAVATAGGVVFNRTGDGMVAAFTAAGNAVAAATQAQQQLATEQWPKQTGALRARMGIHTGEGVVVDGQYLNQPLNRCARLMAIGHGGQVLVSGASEPLLREHLPDGAHLVDLGEHRLRDLSEPMRVFEIKQAALPAAFPPLRSLESFPGNLPLQMSSFVGRERELVRVAKALDDARVVTLTGVGGVGKTRLALQVAAEVLPRFREGAWLVELAPVRDPDAVADAIASMFGINARAGQTIADTLVEFLRTKKLLLVIDNCEHLLEAVADLVEMLERSCADLVVLATSREGLALDGEQNLTVPSLAAPAATADLETIAQSDAVVLFAQRAQRADADFALAVDNAEAVAQVCRRLDGVPLAIELAAAQTAAMTPAELARGLDKRFDTLAGGRRRAVQRHQTLRAAIDWSFELCSITERRLLARLAVFSGGCTREAAEAVCAGDPIDARKVFGELRNLVAKSLVEAVRDGSETRYRLLETIREYGEERLAEHGETERLRATHAAFYRDFALVLQDEMRGPKQIEAGRRLVAEHENVLAAMNYAIDTDNVDLALTLMRNMPGPQTQVGYELRIPMGPVLELSGAPAHYLYPFGVAVAAAQAAAAGDRQTANMRCDQALIAAQSLGDPDRLAEMIVSNTHAALAFAVGATHEAALQMERTLEITRETANTPALAVQLGAAATFHSMAGDAEAAVPLASEGLSLARSLGMPTPIAINLTALAAALADQDPEQARALLEESLQLHANLGYESWGEITQAVLISARLGDWPQTLTLADPSIRHLQWIGDWTLLGVVLNVVARGLVDTDSASAAVLQGAASALVLAAFTQPDRPSDAASAPRSGDSRDFVTQLRRNTTGALFATLGEARVRQLRAEGGAMDHDDAVAYALDAIDRATASRAGSAR